jgi:hypothetical protein
MTVDYWQQMQRTLMQGEVAELRMYPESCKLSA